MKTGFVDMIIFWSPEEIIRFMIYLPFSEIKCFRKLLSPVVQIKDLVNIIIKVKNLSFVLLEQYLYYVKIIKNLL